MLLYALFTGRISTRNKNIRVLASLRSHMAVSTKGASCSRDGLSHETLQLLRLRCVKALTELGAQGVPQVVELFSSYDLGKPVCDC